MTSEPGMAIHHVALETRRADVDACVAFFALLGFALIETPEPVRHLAHWLERDGQQIHLLYADEPGVPTRGHMAVVCPDYEAALARLRAAGFDPAPGGEHWGSPRCSVRDPAGHRVEIMQATPAPARRGAP